jgi:hypothetical protein
VSLLALSVVLTLAGCGGVRLEPVEGKALVDGQPLVHCTFSLRPDAAKGNTSTKEPAGQVEAPGVWKVYTDAKPGAPAGWYKVIAVAQDPVDPNDPYKARPSYINAKYNSLQTTDLVIEVTSTPAPGAYDFNLKK